MAPRKTAAQRAAEEKAASELAAAEQAAAEVVEAPVADEPAADEQPEGDAPVADEQPIVDETPEKTSVPATAQLEPPAQPTGEQPSLALNVSGRVDGAQGQLAAEMVRNEPEGPRSEIVDAATGKPVHPDDAFELEFAHGSIYIVKVRLIENRYFPRMIEPVSRLVLARGSRIGRDNALRLGQHMKATIAAVEAREAAAAVAEQGDEQPEQD